MKMFDGYVVRKLEGDNVYLSRIYAHDSRWTRPYIECAKLFTDIGRAKKTAGEVGGEVIAVKYFIDEIGEKIIDAEERYVD